MTGDRDFDDLWEDYAEMDRDISDALGLEPLTEGDDAEDRKERCRELFEAGRLAFVAGNPVIIPKDNDR
jgi:hypothetical protein